MRIRIVVLWLATLVLFLGARSQDAATEAKVSLSRGIEALRNSNPQLAVENLTRAVQLDPKLTVAELYLAASYATLYVSGVQSAANEELARKALEIYEKLVRTEPDNVDAIAGLSGFYQNIGNFQKARENYLKLTRMTPQSAKVYYSVGAIDWALVYNKSNPLPAAEKTRAIDEGLALLDIAIALDPQYEEAMTYKNLLLREKASATSDPAEKSRLVAEADLWFSRTLEVRKRRLESGQQGGERRQVGLPLPSPPPPPPPPPRGQASASRPGNLVRIGDEAFGTPVLKVNPEYPPLARAAGIQATVILQAHIDKEGKVADLKVVSGHSLLNDAAVSAVSQWRYRPYTLNGEPIEMTTTVAVPFPPQ